ncbi:NO-inducible flavohemoprotein [Povalibacter sp.]|uniref:NO-inducible flavohemoprotein n=1 Tax=Povalibacter sp. TaxID=1962978 RepID=UPI002F3FB054
MLTAQTIAIVKATVPALQAHGEHITRCFYDLLFREHPEVQAFFNQSHQAAGTQQRALADAVLAYAANIDRLEALANAVPRIVQKHAALGVLPEHYPIVGKCLLQAIREVLGSAATEEIIAAWAEAYGALAKIFTAAEETVYRTNERRSGGWRGVRPFVVARRETESEVITSFYLRPQDDRPIPAFEPGQYLTLVLDIDGQSTRRNYSLSCAPNTAGYRISVKREQGGKASNWLHDQATPGTLLNVLPPCGEFVLPPGNERPLVLVTGGVGLTPALSMLHAAASTGRRVDFIHAARNSRTHAFAREVDALVDKHAAVTRLYAYDEPLHEDQPDVVGRLTTQLLAQRLPADRNVDLYLLGPKPFMQQVYRSVLELGVVPARIRYEFFGPLESLEAPAVAAV